MLKRFLFVLVLVLSLLASASAWAATSSDRFTFDDTTGTITAFDGMVNVVDVPTIIRGVKVVAIGNEVFKDQGNLTSVTIPEGVTSIGSGAFSNCQNLSSVNLPSTLTSIGDYAFSNCVSSSYFRGGVLGTGPINYTTSITIPSGVTRIGVGVFNGCLYLGSVVLPTTVTSIGDSAFASCIKLTSVGSLAGVTSIGDSAFSGCSILNNITLPLGLKSIGDSAFSSCQGLANFTMSTTVTSIGNRAFQDCSKLTSITLPSGITTINEAVFASCSTLSSITIPGTVTIINKEAFAYCTSLKSIDIPSSVTSIGVSAFTECQNLASITLHDGLANIGNNAFMNCAKLTSVTLPESMTAINQSLFQGCSSLTNIKISSNVTSIGSSAFYGCSKLSSVEIPSVVTNIGDYAFSACSALANVTFLGNAPTVGSRVFTSNPLLRFPSQMMDWTYPFWNGYITTTDYTVNFDKEGVISSAIINRGATATPPDTLKVGYEFLGWFTSGGIKVTDFTNITANATYYARWQIKTYTVTFVDGDKSTPIPVEFGAMVTPPQSTKDGYALSWYTEAMGGTEVVGFTNVTANATYYAHWNLSATASGIKPSVSTPIASDSLVTTVTVPSGEIESVGVVMSKDVPFEVTNTTVKGLDNLVNFKLTPKDKDNKLVTSITDGYLILEIVLPPDLAADMAKLVVYYTHAGKARLLTSADPGGPDGGAYYTVNTDGKSIVLYARVFSTLSLGFAPPVVITPYYPPTLDQDPVVPPVTNPPVVAPPVAPPAPVLSSNAMLKAFKVSKGSPSPKFSAGKTKYKLTLKSSWSSVKLTAYKASGVARVKVSTSKSTGFKSASSYTLKLKRGKSKTVYFKVYAQNGSTKTYSFLVKRK